jgi:glycosyltransferase involved in cell wall biosynthesis
MKILYHHRTRSKDGQTVHIEEMLHALRTLGHEVIVVAPPAMQAAEFGDDAGFVATLKQRLPPAFYELLELGYSLVAYRRLRQAYLRHRPVVLFERCNLFLLAGLWLKRRYRLPMLIEVNAPLAQERDRYGGLALKRLAIWAERTVWRAGDYVLPVTDVLAGHLRRAGVPAQRIHIIPNGISEVFLPAVPDGAAVRRRFGLDRRVVLGFTGFMRAWHGLDRVIDLIADSDPGRGLHMLLVGDGPARADLERQAASRGVADRVTFTGIVGRDEVAGYVAAFDVALQPQVVDYASPLKVFEYMGLGRDIVAPATANIREVLQHEHSALLFDPADAGAFRTAVERLAGDEALRRRLGANARAEIDRQGLTWANNARRVVDLFERTLAPPGPEHS